MKVLVLCAGSLLCAMSSLVMANDCAQLVHDRTMVPVSELSTLGDNGSGLTTVIRHKTTTHSVFGGPVHTEFQCDGKGLYRQLLPTGWSVWRTGNEWNAVHWITF